VERPLVFAWNRLTPGELGLELTTLLSVAAVGSFAFFGYIIVLQDVVTTPGDMRAMRISADLYSATLVDVAKALTWLGSAPLTWTAAIAASVWLFVEDRRLEAAVIFFGMVLTIIGVHVTKDLMDRPRPADPLASAAGESYPSGHTAYAMVYVAIAVALNRAAPALRRYAILLVAVALVVIVGLTRVYLRVHYLSDVLGGAGLAAMCFAVCAVVALIVDFVRHNGMKAS
jgi:undecaprenyl-diphosphatase